MDIKLKKYRVIEIDNSKQIDEYSKNMDIRLVIQSKHIFSPIWMNEGWCTILSDCVSYIDQLKKKPKVIYKDRSLSDGR